MNNNGQMGTDIPNPQRGPVFISIGIIVMGIALMFLPGIIGMDGFNGGFALAFFGGFVVIIGIISVIFFARLASLFTNIMKKENILAHWVYNQADWQKYVEEEHIADTKDKRNLFFLVAVISVVVGIILWAMHPGDGLIVFFIIVGLIAVIGLTAFLSILAPYRSNLKNRGEVYITKDGAYLARRLHIWKGLGTRLESALYETGQESLPRIVIAYSSINTTMRNSYTLRIPVPRGQEQTAKNIVEQIQTSQG